MWKRDSKGVCLRLKWLIKDVELWRMKQSEILSKFKVKGTIMVVLIDLVESKEGEKLNFMILKDIQDIEGK